MTQGDRLRGLSRSGQEAQPRPDGARDSKLFSLFRRRRERGHRLRRGDSIPPPPRYFVFCLNFVVGIYVHTYLNTYIHTAVDIYTSVHM